MNNDAFQKLVRERANGKGSKEIAREAVEEEFQQHRRKRRRRGGGSSSDEDGGSNSDNDNDQRRKKEKQNRQKQKEQKDETEDKESSNYRDRAKERREGNNMDYLESQRLLAGMKDAEKEAEDADLEQISKYLGGDDAHTHLVKGLDLTLAQRASAGKKENAGSKLKGTTSDKVEAPVFAKNAKQVKALLEANSVTAVSDLGHDILDYLRSYHLPNQNGAAGSTYVTSSGLAVQRSTLTFSLQAAPGNFLCSWEIPKEQTYATSDNRAFKKASPLGIDLLDRIEKVLSKRLPMMEQISSTPSVPSTSRADTEPNSGEEADSDDDDIFGNVGDYVAVEEAPNDDGPTTNGASDHRPETATGSVFETTALFSVATSSSRPVAETKEDNGSIDLDSQDGSSEEPATRDAQPTSSVRLVGFSSAPDTVCGYGDDMDMDFDGMAEDRATIGDASEDTKSKKKRKRKGEHWQQVETSRAST